GTDRVKGLMGLVGLEEDMPLEHRLVDRALEAAQTKVEGMNFDARKHVVEYDDVMNKQREVIYAERNKILAGADLRANIRDMIERELRAPDRTYLPDLPARPPRRQLGRRRLREGGRGDPAPTDRSGARADRADEPRRGRGPADRMVGGAVRPARRRPRRAGGEQRRAAPGLH